MMNTEREQEKSVILLKLLGYQVLNTLCGERGRVICDQDGCQISPARFLTWETAVHLSYDEQFKALCPNIYNPGCMALAWRVLNWAMEQDECYLEHDHYTFAERIADEFSDNEMLILPPEAAQKSWLDAILDLAIKSGLADDIKEIEL